MERETGRAEGLRGQVAEVAAEAARPDHAPDTGSAQVTVEAKTPPPTNTVIETIVGTKHQFVEMPASATVSPIGMAGGSKKSASP